VIAEPLLGHEQLPVLFLRQGVLLIFPTLRFDDPADRLWKEPEDVRPHTVGVMPLGGQTNHGAEIGKRLLKLVSRRRCMQIGNDLLKALQEPPPHTVSAERLSDGIGLLTRYC